MKTAPTDNPRSKRQTALAHIEPLSDLSGFLPDQLAQDDLSQTDIPRIAKDPRLIRQIEEALHYVPTQHLICRDDARNIRELPIEGVHLILTSPPYWTLKEYRESDGQLGHVRGYEEFLTELDRVWQQCYDALIPGGRLVCVVGDVCLARRKNGGRHSVVPLHAAIQEHCRAIGFDNLAPILWHKIANAAYEAGGGSTFLGKPYEPNAVIKNDIEFILMQRKPGGYRTPHPAARLLSIISEPNHRKWFQQIWTGLTGASTKHHPAPYPLELAERLIRMFSFVGDIVMDPFMGTATTNVAAAKCGRNSIGIEVDPVYFDFARNRMQRETLRMFRVMSVHFYEAKEQIGERGQA